MHKSSILTKLIAVPRFLLEGVAGSVGAVVGARFRAIRAVRHGPFGADASKQAHRVEDRDLRRASPRATGGIPARFTAMEASCS